MTTDPTNPTHTDTPTAGASPAQRLGQFIKPDPTLRFAWKGLLRWQAPVWLKLSIITFIVLTWLPLAVAFEMRTNKAKREPRIHLVQDLDNQPKLKAQDEFALFADDRAMRQRIPGTVARGELVTDPNYEYGYTPATGADGKPAAPNFITDWPAPIQAILNDPAQAKAFIERGQAKFNITCAMCHGVNGEGNGPIAQRAAALGATQTGWVQPSNMNDDVRRSRPVGHLYNTVNNGIRHMGGYGTQLNVDERWAVVAYVRTLQLAHAAQPSALTDEQRRALQ